MANSTIQERLRDFIKSQRLNVSQFEKQLSFSNGFVNSISKNISAEKMGRIAEQYPDLNENWLLTGEGSMLKETAPVLTFAPAEAVDLTESDQFYLPLIPVDAIAGFGQGGINGISIDDCEKYCLPDLKGSGADFIIRVAGDSMLPNYKDGDVIACKKLTDTLFWQPGRVYVLDTEQGCLIKVVYEDPNDDSCLICHSFNTERYGDFRLPKSSIRAVCIVILTLSVRYE